jgi:nitroimidazol reductase NimA-like FMN-containing flavoprotein (pyridoxamine 5'-phosphate oxidase superfamily)
MKTITIDNKTELEEVIISCKHCVLSTVSSDGSPYSVPMNFAYSEGEIILHSAPTGTHLANIQHNNTVCVVFCTDGNLVYQHKEVACSYRMRAKSVICKGKVRFIESDEEKIQVMNKFMGHYTANHFSYSKPAIQNVKVWIVEVSEMTGKAFAVPHK